VREGNTTVLNIPNAATTFEIKFLDRKHQGFQAIYKITIKQKVKGDPMEFPLTELLECKVTNQKGEPATQMMLEC
jgi:hypothetical protein